MSSRFKTSAISVLIATLLAATAGTLVAHTPEPGKTEQKLRLAVNVAAPQFTLIDQDGKPFVSADRLRGKVVAVNFIYTTCADVCPLFTVEFARLQRALKSSPGRDFFLLSITTDPEIDSPKVLKAYGRRFDADFDSWAFLTGQESRIKDIWKAFGVKVIRKDRGLVQHTNLTTLIDRRGMRRINFVGSKWQYDVLMRDMRALDQPNHDVGSDWRR